MLGVCWKLCNSELRFGVADVSNKAKQIVPTKHNVVSIIGHFYDLLGYLSPIVVRFKVLFQELCKSGIKYSRKICWTSESSCVLHCPFQEWPP